MNDLLAGRVQLLFINLDAVIPQLGGGRLVPLAITSGRRNPLFPDLPTVAESGFPGFEATAWAYRVRQEMEAMFAVSCSQARRSLTGSVLGEHPG